MTKLDNSKAVRYDYTNWNAMVTLLAKSAGVPVKKVIRHEMEKVLAKAIKLTPQAKKGNITKRWTIKGSVAQHKGNDPPEQIPELIVKFQHNGETIEPRKAIHSDDLARVKGIMNDQKKERYDRVGLCRSSWLWVAKKFKLESPLTSKAAENAFAKNSWYGGKIKVKEYGDDEGYSMKFEINGKALFLGGKGRKALSTALDGRIKFCEKNIEKGVLEDPKKFADKYGFAIQG
jgi:hypothetical protein